jgi:hypothetical protein
MYMKCPRHCQGNIGLGKVVLFQRIVELKVGATLAQATGSGQIYAWPKAVGHSVEMMNCHCFGIVLLL